MDAIILVILIVLTIVFFRKFSNVVYIICIFDIFLRILSKLEQLLNIGTFSNIVNKYFPNSILGIINNNSSGIINTILVYLYLFIYVVFLTYIIRTFFKKKK